MINRLYNPWQITNSGEREADRHFALSKGKEDELISIVHQLRISSRFHKTQMSGECDFVVFTTAGIIVIEVKGGLIGFGKTDDKNRGYFRKIESDKKEIIKDPFMQANANSDAIKCFLKEKGIADVFVGHMVCFPECIFAEEGISIQYLWHRGTTKGLLDTLSDALQDQILAFQKAHEIRNKAFQAHWNTLDEASIHHITELLSPEFEPRLYLTHTRLNLDESQRRSEEGVNILRGLGENKRIMVQGPPGSGKSTYAFDLILRLCNEEGKRGLYLCWNELLAARMQEKLKSSKTDIPEGSITVKPYFHFLEDLAAIHGDKTLVPTYEKVSMGGVYELAKESLGKLHKSGKLPKYDFLVVDEAQDIFDKGLDQVIKSVLKVNNPLSHGNYYIFFDDSQAYPRKEDLDRYIRTRDTLSDASAYYVLFSNLRVNTGLGLSRLILDAGKGSLDPEMQYGEDVKFSTWKTPEELPGLLDRYIQQEKILGKFDDADMIVLFTADLLKKESAVENSMANDQRFEFLDKNNLSTSPVKARYTTALKSKGLEWDMVFLVTSSIADPKIMHQLFIGASRGKGKVYVMTFTL
jgi:hypothetical protein